MFEWLFRWLIALSLLNCFGGCAGWKAVDTTAAIEAVTAGEHTVTYTVVPGDIIGLGDKSLAIPTVPGKDVQFRYSKTAEGAVEMTLGTTRSEVLDVLFAAAAGIDAEKFAEDARTRAWVSAEREAWMAVVGPLIQQAMNRPPAPTPDTPRPTLREQVLELLRDPEVIRLLKSEG